MNASMQSVLKLKAFRLKSLKKRKTTTVVPPKPPENIVDTILGYKTDFLDVTAEEEDIIDPIPDIFEEFHRNSYLKLQPDNRYLTKTVADRKTMGDFPPNFKDIFKELRAESKNNQSNLIEEDLDEIINNLTNNSYEKFIFTDRNKHKESRLNEDLQVEMKSPNGSEEFDDSSGVSCVWERLENNVDGEKFHLTSPGFNLYRQDKKHWLERASISWEEVDKSREKCEDWFGKYHHTFSKE